MPNRDWIKPVAIGLIALSLTFIWAAFYVGSEIGKSRGESNKHTAKYERYAKEQISSTCLSGQGGDIAECVSEIIKATEEYRRAEDDLVAQTEMALWAFYMFIFTAIMAVITGAGVYYVWRQLSVTREIGEAQVRSYLGVKEVTYNRDKEGSSKLDIWIENTGQSPAFGVMFSIKVYLRDEGTKADICRPCFKEISIGSIAAQSKERQVLTVFDPLDHDGRIVLKYSAKIKFRTVFPDHKPMPVSSSGAYTMVNIRKEGGGRQKVSVKNGDDQS